MPGMAAADPLVLLRTCSSMVEAKALHAMLEAEGIDVLIHGEHHRAQLGFLGPYVDLRLMVRASALDDARELIEEADYAEHLPPDDASPQEDDLSMKKWRESAGEEPPDLEPLDGPRPRFAFLPVVLAVSIGLGTGHMYGRRWGIAAVLFVVQIFLFGLAFGGHTWAAPLNAIAHLIDAVGGVMAVRTYNASLAGQRRV
jgi:hypothetical protein